MQRLWGRKVGDLGFAKFLQTLEWIATKKGKQVVLVDPWYASTKTCWHCNYKLDKLELKVREWQCPDCLQFNLRDLNAALNIKRVGASTLERGNVRQSRTAIAV